MIKLNSLKSIKALEHKGVKCSKKYVPIKTTEFIKNLKSFEFTHGLQYRSSSSAHFVELTKGDGITVRIENSFDRMAALSLSFNFNGFIFGKIRQIHIGQSAAGMMEVSGSIDNWYMNAIKTIDTMRTISLSQHDMTEIASKAFKDRGVNIGTVTNFTTEGFKNSLDFVMYLVNGLRDGYFVRNSPSGSKPINPVKREILMIKINNNIWKYLEDNNPELYV